MLLAFPSNENHKSCPQESPPPWRNGIRPLLFATGGRVRHQDRLPDNRLEVISDRAKYRGFPRRADATTAMERVDVVRARASSRRSLASGSCHFSPGLA